MSSSRKRIDDNDAPIHRRDHQENDWHVNFVGDQENWNQQFKLVFEHNEKSFANPFSYEDGGIVFVIGFNAIPFSNRIAFTVGVNLV